MKYYKNLPKGAKQVKGALTWVTPDGKLWGQETRTCPNRWNNTRTPIKHYGEYFQYSLIKNKHNGYIYAPVKYISNDKSYNTKQRRVHIIIAETFIPNPNNYPVVGHKNNIKSDNRVENLYWTTPSENTQKAVNDGLLVNKKGAEDSQSMPVFMFDTYTNQKIGEYGSATIASEETGISMSTILRQCRYKRPVRKKQYFRFQNDKSLVHPPVIVQYDYFTDEELGRYWNTREASRQTGVSEKVISQQSRNGWKPKTKTKSKTYFLWSSQEEIK